MKSICNVCNCLLLCVLLVNCAKKLEHTEASSSTQVLFDPAATIPVVPAPNDLAFDPTTGLLNVPIDPNAHPAQQAFNRQYLNTLNGFPFESTVSASFSGPVEPTTVTAATLLVIDLGPPAGTPQVPAAVTVVPALDSTGTVITVAPPNGQWTRGHRYVAAILGGQAGIKDTHGDPVTGSSTWYLVSSSSSLVSCQTLTDPSCRPSISIIPSSETDPAARLSDQTAKAIALEQLRRGYSPLLDLLQAQGHARSDVAALWTFTIVNRPELTFDPENSVIPFPNDVVRVPPTAGAPAHVNLPIPPGAPASQAALIAGLNTLDGFSTTAPIVTSNSDTLGALSQGTLSTASALFVKLNAQGQAIASPDVTVCISCRVSAPLPQRLQIVPNVPLDEKSTYLAYVLDNITETQGATPIASPAFALVRLNSPLVDNNGHTQVSIITDAQAQALEPLRQAMQPAFTSLETQGTDRSHVLLAWGFTTASIVTPASSPVLTLAALKAVPAQLGLPVAVTSPVPLGTDSAGNYLVQGQFQVAFSLNGPGGVLDPSHAVLQPTNFLAVVPHSATTSSAPLPVVIFGHGLGGNKTQVLSNLADSLASAGFIVVATDVVFHGERSDCRGSHIVLPPATSDNAACADPVNQSCSQATGFCVKNDNTPGGDFLRCCTPPSAGPGCVPATANPSCSSTPGAPVISGWNILNLNNLFAARDNFRQQVIDLAQLTRVIMGTAGTSPTSFEQALSAGVGAAINVDETQIHYVGMSLGGILGSLYTSVAPEIHRVVLNVPGGGLVANVLLSSPAFAPQKVALVATLGAQGILPGTPAFDDFIATAEWITDPADPLNAAYGLTHDLGGSTPYPPPDRKVLVQYIDNDQVIPNAATEALIAAARLPVDKSKGEAFKFTGSSDFPSAAYLHGFILEPFISGGTARAQINTFLQSGTLP